MYFRKLLSLSSLSLLLLHVSCGPKDEIEDVNMSNLDWVDGNTLNPNSKLTVKGDIEGNKPFAVSFALTNPEGKIIGQNIDGLKVVSQHPPSGKTNLSLVDDMKTELHAGSDVCNGSYVLHVIAKSGKAEVKKPLPFTVVNGKDPSECKKANLEEIKFGHVGNLLGKDPSGYNLEEGHSVRKDEENRDVHDITTTHDFSSALGSATKAKFVLAPLGTDFYNMDYASANKIYESRLKLDETPRLHTNDIVLVYLERTNSLFILKISVNPNEHIDPTSQNKGILRFAYRKLIK